VEFVNTKKVSAFKKDLIANSNLALLKFISVLRNKEHIWEDL